MASLQPVTGQDQAPQVPSLLEEVEAPVHSLPPGKNLLSPPKALKEMNDEELAAWDELLRQHLTSPQTLMSHLRAGGTTARKRTDKEMPAPDDLSEYQ